MFVVEAGDARASRSARRTRRWASRGALDLRGVLRRRPRTRRRARSAAEGSGFRAAMSSLAQGRLHIAAICVGHGAAGPRRVGRLRRRAAQGGAPIGRFQLVQAMLADTHDRAARRPRDGAARPPPAGTAARTPDRARRAAKLFCSEMVGRAVDRAVQVHGGLGYMRSVAGRALLPRRPAVPDLRGHQRDPEAGDRRPAAGERLGRAELRLSGHPRAGRPGQTRASRSPGSELRLVMHLWGDSAPNLVDVA